MPYGNGILNLTIRLEIVLISSLKAAEVKSVLEHISEYTSPIIIVEQASCLFFTGFLGDV